VFLLISERTYHWWEPSDGKTRCGLLPPMGFFVEGMRFVGFGRVGGLYESEAAAAATGAKPCGNCRYLIHGNDLTDPANGV
jgi:hypothetical protein